MCLTHCAGLRHFVSPRRQGKAAFQRQGWMLRPSSFDQSPCLVIQGKVNSWTCSCWGKAPSSFLQAQPISAWLGEIILQTEALCGGGSFSLGY